MTEEDANIAKRGGSSGWSALQRHRGKLIFAAVLVSLLVHTVSVVELGHRGNQKNFSLNQQKQAPIKFKVVEVPPVKKKADEPEVTADNQKILEMPQQKTEPADDAKYLGTVDHKAKQEMRVSEKLQREKAVDPGQKGNPDVKPDVAVEFNKPPQKKPEATAKQNEIKINNKIGRLSMDAYTPERRPRNTYEALLPTSIADLPGQVSAGFQDFVDDKILEGDRIDISTSEYRYIGYFTTMRKDIERVWNYPMEASRRGMQGEVGLEFAINKDGRATRIRVIKSSGFPILDRAIVEAIKLASPFSPLPTGFGRQRLVITGSFRYILSAYGSH